MKPPKPFNYKRANSYSLCMACDKWTPSNAIFLSEGTYWTLCHVDYADYWENTNELPTDFKGFTV